MDGQGGGGRRIITGASNPLVKFARSLRDKKHRRREERFLAEGLRLLSEAREAGHLPETLFMATGRAAHPLVTTLEEAVAGAGGDVIELAPDLLSRITGKDNPQAVAGIFSDIAVPLDAIDRHAADIWLVAQALRDPGNCGTMLRTGDAVGAGGLILLDECVDPFSAEAVRASMGAVFTQKVAMAGWEEFLAWLRAGDGELVAAALTDGSRDYQAPRYRPPVFVLVGNESRGLPPHVEAEADQCVTIPMLGRADSLNAAIAAAVLAYEVRNQLRRA